MHEKEMFELFIEESIEQVEKIEEGLLSIEKEYDEYIIKEIFRMIHSLKGSSSSMGFGILSELTHDMESLLDKIKTKTIELNKDVINLMFECLDKIKEIKDNIVKYKNDNVNTYYIHEKIIKLVGTQHIKKNNKNVLDKFDVTEYELLTIEDAVKKSQNVFIIKVDLEENAEMKAMKAFLAINNLKNIGQMLRVYPQNYETIGENEFEGQFKLILITSKTREYVIKNIDVAGDIKNITIEQFEGRETPNKNTIDIKVNEKLQDNSLFRTEKRDHIRVNIAKLDKLIGFIGELVIDSGRLIQIKDKLKTKYKRDPDIKELVSAITHVDYLGTELQNCIMAVRVYTVENIFNRFQRMVRDLGNRSNKEINFITEGKNTELDRGILEDVVDPIVHLLRNAVDHGIETVEERISKGKEPQATIYLRAKHQENSVIIEIEDDGKGIDIEAIKNKAFDKKIITQNEFETISDQDALNLIFLSGFSTAKVVTNVSGRGVGMDVVKTNIEKLNGIIEIESQKDKGCKFIIKLPLTLAIIQALLVMEGQIRFAIPLSLVIETARLKQSEMKKNIKKVKGKETYIWREQLIPIVKLGKNFDINEGVFNDKVFLIIIGLHEKRICLMVERLSGEQQIVIKNLGEYLGKGKILGDVKGISGATILGDGNFAYVLDVPEILKKLKESK